jgi:hypothetical protein
MKTIRSAIVAILAIASLPFLAGCSRTSDKPDRPAAQSNPIVSVPATTKPITTSAPPKSLIVAAGRIDARARGIQRLLERHGVPTTVVSARSVDRNWAAGFDLIIVVGNGRETLQLPEFTQPVLGVGCCGCRFFGTLRLKNGEPWT